ncbi:MAG TPA: PaaI family thioesterase [Chthoniobacterales bacterium]|nr:PaaI family thioesterase [Chthoniobacterales bacterium]
MAEPRNPGFEQAVRDSFAAQQLMATIGARLTNVTAGEIEIRVPFRRDLTQQHGFLHAGVVTSALDSACGYSALSLMEEGVGVLTVEFKTNLLAPARGDELIARGRVLRAGRTISVCQAEAAMLAEGAETSVAIMIATVMTVRSRSDVVG